MIWRIHPPVLFLAIGWWMVLPGPAQARPRPAPKLGPSPTATLLAPTTTPASSGAVSSEGTMPLAQWLAAQNGSPNAVTLPLGQIIQAATGSTVVPLDRRDPTQTTFLQDVGTLLDGILPRMNQPNSPARQAADADQAALAFAAALSEKLLASEDLTGSRSGTRRVLTAAYPSFTASKNGWTCCLGVSLFSAADRDKPVPALRVRAAEAAGFKSRDGTVCLLVVIETNGKTGQDAAFLNWELRDVSTLPVRAAMTFEGAQDALRVPGTLLNDGRKGRD